MQAFFLLWAIVGLIMVLCGLFSYITSSFNGESSTSKIGIFVVGCFLILVSSIGSSLLKENDEKQAGIEKTQIEAEREVVPADEILVDDSLPNSIFDSFFRKEEEPEEIPSKPSKTDSTVIFTEND